MTFDKITLPRFAPPVNLGEGLYEQWINDLWFACNPRNPWRMDIREVLFAQPVLRDSFSESDTFLSRLINL